MRVGAGRPSPGMCQYSTTRRDELKISLGQEQLQDHQPLLASTMVQVLSLQVDATALL